MARYEIHGGNPLNGTVTISGAKNAAVAILPAALLVSGKCRIENVPDISDVRIILNILAGMGVKIESPEPHVVEMDSTDVQYCEPDSTLVRKMRASYYLMGAMLGRFMWLCPAAAISLPVPLTSTSKASGFWVRKWMKMTNMLPWNPVKTVCMAAVSAWIWHPSVQR